MGQEELNQICAYIDEALERKFRKLAAMLRPEKDELTQRQARERYGRKWLENKENLGLVTKHRAGKHKRSPWVYSDAELMNLKMKDNENLRRIERNDARRPCAACS